MEGPTAVLIGAGLATCGWLYSARRARTLSRKQHTVNVMLQASFNEDFRASIDLIAEAMKRGKCPDLQTGDNDALNKALMLVTNHMEFIAAGLRNGDFDESLVKDSWRGQTLVLFEFYEENIWKLRNARRRLTMYEHFEWLYRRWETSPPSRYTIWFEKCVGRPMPGTRINPRR